MRLFVAINLSDDILKYLFSLRDSLIINGNINTVKNTHLTLKFLGETEDSKKDEIIDILNNLSFKSFKIQLDSFGLFPNENYFRVLWVGITPEEKVIELQKGVDNSLSSLFPIDKKFKPHITLARIKFIINKDEFLKQLQLIKIEQREITIDKFSLIKSTLTKSGPVYEIIEEFPAS